MAIFDDLIKRASEFVEKQKGVWDHSKWQVFLSDAQQKGVKMTEEMQSYLGSVLDSMKKYYENTTDTGRKMMGNVSDQTSTFIEKTKGKWEHLEWEKFLKDIQQRGIDLSRETMTNIGGVLESAKKFYFSLPLITKKEEKEPEITKAPEKFKAPRIPEAKVPGKPAKPTEKKATKAKAPKKKEKPPEKKPVEKVEIKKAEETKATKAVKAVPPKKKATKESTAKKPTTKGTAKTKTVSASKKK